MTVVIRDAVQDDLPMMLDIYNEVLRSSTAIFSDTERTMVEQHNWFRERAGQNRPVLVACVNGELVGYASYGAFRSWPGYRHTVENSIYLAPAARGHGIGRTLLQALIDRADAQGVHAIIAGIDGDNVRSMRLHAGLGFAEVARLKEVGRKFDRWLDLVFYERICRA